MARRHRFLSLAVTIIVLSTTTARADFLIDDFQGPVGSTTFFVGAPTALPAVGNSCTPLTRGSGFIVVANTQPATRCVAGVQAGGGSSIIGGNRDLFATILASSGSAQTFTASAGDGQLVFDLSNSIGGYLRVEWDGSQTIADDTLTLTNNRIDLPVTPYSDPQNPFNTPGSVDNLDEFFGLPQQMPGRALLSGGIDNDRLQGKLDHSTVDRRNGLGGIDLTEGWGAEGHNLGRFEIGLNSADNGGFFRLTVYSGETAGSYFSGAFPGYNPNAPDAPPAPLIVPVAFSQFEPIPTMSGPNSSNPIYSPGDFTRVTAIVFELLNENSLDSTLALLRTSIPPRPAPTAPTIALMLIGLAALSVMQRMSNLSFDVHLA